LKLVYIISHFIFKFNYFSGLFYNSLILFRLTVVKWSNSHGIMLPKVFLQNIKLSENDSVDITMENERIVIKNIKKKRKL